MSFFICLFNNKGDRYREVRTSALDRGSYESLTPPIDSPGFCMHFTRVLGFYYLDAVSFFFINTSINAGAYFSDSGSSLIQNSTELRNEISWLVSLNTLTALGYGLSRYVIMTKCLYPDSRSEIMIPTHVRRSPLCYLGPADGVFLFLGGLFSGFVTALMIDPAQTNRKLDIVAFNFKLYTFAAMIYLLLKTVCLSKRMRQPEPVVHDEIDEGSLDNSIGI